MDNKKSRLEIVTQEAEEAAAETNRSINRLGIYTGQINESLKKIQELFDRIRNIPSDKRTQYGTIKKARLAWKKQVEQIEHNYKMEVAKDTGAGVVAAGTGVAVAAMGPTVAMGLATTVGVASTGTAISALSGAAATNAALAWLGGGALAAGGGGMVAGHAFLALLGPIGWIIAGSAMIGSGLMLWKINDDKAVLEDLFADISRRDINSYRNATVEINERIKRIRDENKKLKEAIRVIQSFGLDYEAMTEKQQHTLGAYVNLMNASTQLLINPIRELQQKYTEKDFRSFAAEKQWNPKSIFYQTNKNVIISFANLLYGVSIDTRKISLLTKAFKENKQFLESSCITKEQFDKSIIETAVEGLQFKERTKMS